MKNQLALAVIFTSLLSLNTQAASTTSRYFVSGKQVTSLEALNAAITKQEVLKCQSVELAPSKSGTSFSLKTPKKPKAE